MAQFVQEPGFVLSICNFTCLLGVFLVSFDLDAIRSMVLWRARSGSLICFF